MNAESVQVEVTILTDPMPWGREFLHENTRRFVRLVRDQFCNTRNYDKHPQYRGHFAVTRSLVEGLKKINANFQYNPSFPNLLADTVVVLAGVRTLRQAIQLKRQGRIKALYAGPNIVTFASDFDSIIASPEIDGVITPCEWVIDLYLEDCPSLKGRCFAWPAGVDTRYWKPDTSTVRRQILIFEKQNKGPVGPVQPYVEYLEQCGYHVVIMKYGSFDHDQYLMHLRRSCLMIGFVTDESQGIAWAEAWSADVPTLIWKNTSHLQQGRIYRSSTAPYLCEQNGLFFDNIEDFKIKLDSWVSNQKQFTPREWTLENMSDEICAAKLLNIVKSVNN